jgi:hypothetical protein
MVGKRDPVVLVVIGKQNGTGGLSADGSHSSFIKYSLLQATVTHRQFPSLRGSPMDARVSSWSPHCRLLQCASRHTGKVKRMARLGLLCLRIAVMPWQVSAVNLGSAAGADAVSTSARCAVEAHETR